MFLIILYFNKIALFLNSHYNKKMNELDMLKIIQNKLSRTEFLGNDCAKIYDYVSHLPLIVTHDTLVQDVHFSLNTTNPYELAIKSVSVNVSDLRASLALPKYLSISLSMPENISSSFVEKFYEGIEFACNKYKCCVCGGDLTKSDKIVISICAIGQQIRRLEVGRQYAQEGDLVLLFGKVGYSDIGLRELTVNNQEKSIFTQAHLQPEIDLDLIYKFSELPLTSLCAMDTSDGLADVVYKISTASNCSIEINGNNLPISDDFMKKCTELNLDYKKVLMYGAEDFSLITTLNPEYARILNVDDFSIIGKVINSSVSPVSKIKFKDEVFEINEETIKTNTYQHFYNK